MRLDKFLSYTRILKTRTLVKTAADEGMVYINGQKAKPASMVRLDDVIEVDIPRFYRKIRVLALPYKNLKKSEASSLYEILEARTKDLI